MILIAVSVVTLGSFSRLNGESGIVAIILPVPAGDLIELP
jgi:hypothetical protein